MDGNKTKRSFSNFILAFHCIALYIEIGEQNVLLVGLALLAFYNTKTIRQIRYSNHFINIKFAFENPLVIIFFFFSVFFDYIGEFCSGFYYRSVQVHTNIQLFDK